MVQCLLTSCLKDPVNFVPHSLPPQENVEGPDCDRCKLGFYNLQSDNRRGCEKCSCMGASTQCSASTWTYRNVGRAIFFFFFPFLEYWLRFNLGSASFGVCVRCLSRIYPSIFPGCVAADLFTSLLYR